jgi:DNA adenine methylase
VKYNQKLFSFEDQKRLADAIDKIRSKGGFYILTNAAHSSIASLFDRQERRIEVRRRNNVGGIGAPRGNAAEYLFTNVPGHD